MSRLKCSTAYRSRGLENRIQAVVSGLRFALLFATRCLGPVILLAATGAFHSQSALSLKAADIRLADDRPPLNREELKASGLHILESRHLILVTDVPLADVQDLPALADALFDELQRQLGSLAPDIAGKEFQVTGYLMDAQERFDKAGLLPPEQFAFRHGRHMRYQFWMNNQTSPYYRRHLLLHEFVHCFIMCEHGMRDIPPLWYTEGIAEVFATHALEKDITKSQFGILPPTIDQFEGWGRITQIQRTLRTPETAGSDNPENWSLGNLRHPASSAFHADLQYAQAWALVWFLRNHPELKNDHQVFNSVRTEKDFLAAERTLGSERWQRLERVWPLFLDSLVEGFDSERSFPELRVPDKPASASRTTPITLSIAADKGWQPAGLTLQAGQAVTLECSGRYTVHHDPKPWIAEPQGITIDYHLGRPLGEIVAMLISADSRSAPRRIPVGTGGQLTATEDSELWLQINDSAASRKGNSGSAEIRIR